MNPVEVNLGVGPAVIYAKKQPPYAPLPAEDVPLERGLVVVSRWALSAEERAELAAGGDLYVAMRTFGMPPMPIKLVGTAQAMREFLKSA